MSKEDCAVLSSFDKYTTFSFSGTTLTFRTCNDLEKYTKIKLWDNGYQKEEVEEFIDLDPILRNLFKNKDSFLKPIKNVRIEYA